MELPALTSIEGAYWYLISIIVVTAAVCGLYAAAAVLGLAPEPSRLIDGVPFLAPSTVVRVPPDVVQAPSDAVQTTSNAVRRSASIASTLLGS